MQRMLKKIRNCDCQWEEVYPNVWVLVAECHKCQQRRRIQRQLDTEEMEEERLRIIEGD